MTFLILYRATFWTISFQLLLIISSKNQLHIALIPPPLPWLCRRRFWPGCRHRTVLCIPTSYPPAIPHSLQERYISLETNTNKLCCLHVWIYLETNMNQLPRCKRSEWISEATIHKLCFVCVGNLNIADAQVSLVPPVLYQFYTPLLHYPPIFTPPPLTAVAKVTWFVEERAGLRTSALRYLRKWMKTKEFSSVQFSSVQFSLLYKKTIVQ